jgi:hypothetical protein
MPAESPLESLVDLRITHFIAHIIDHQTGSLGLSALATPLGSGFPHDFFKQYILHAVSDPLRRRACFRTPSGVVSGAYAAVSANAQGFVAASQTVASHLYEIMGRSSYKRRIKPGDIMVALFEDAAQETGKGPRYLAILKIDPSDGIIRNVVQIGGKQQVTFETRNDRVPTAEENKIQKIALIGKRQTQPEPHDLVLLDNNIKQVGVAHFFYDEFLESTLKRDAREVTQFLVRDVKKFVSQKADVVTPMLTPAERLRIVDGTVAYLRRGVPVELGEIAQQGVELPDRPGKDVQALRAALVEHLSSHGRPEERIKPQETVPVSPAAAEEEVASITYILDGGIEIRGKADEVNQRVEFSAPDAARTFTITIRTQTLEIA